MWTSRKHMYTQAQHIDDLIEEMKDFECNPRHKDNYDLTLSRRQIAMLISEIERLEDRVIELKVKIQKGEE